MNSPDPQEHSVFRDRAFLLLTIAVTLAFGWILWPFFSAVFWAAVLAILFVPLHRRIVRSLGPRRALAALCTVTVILVIVILPLAVITGMLVKEGLLVYERIQSGELNFGRYFQQMLAALPAWATGLLDRFGLASLVEIQARLSAGFTKGIQFIASQALNLGQNTFEFLINFFIMLYLLFFLLRDGRELARSMHAAVPLERGLQQDLARKFTVVIRATVKGNIVVALVQGALGALIFWILDIRAPVFWGVLMAFLSLLPAVGTGLVWGPVAIYFLVTGAVWEGVILIAYGVLVIGLVDNVLRPLLVGKDTKMPDYVVLISTLGGLAIFGLNGFVIGPVIAALFIAVWQIVALSRK